VSLPGSEPPAPSSERSLAERPDPQGAPTRSAQSAQGAAARSAKAGQGAAARGAQAAQGTAAPAAGSAQPGTAAGGDPPLSVLALLLDVGLRVVGGVVATIAAALFALLAVLLVPLRIGSVPIPIAFVVVIVGNILVIRYARRVTGSRLGVVGPCVAWFAVMLTAGQRTIEGDVLLPGDWRGLGLLFIGALSLAITAYFAVAPNLGPPTATPPTATPPRAPTGTPPGAPTSTPPGAPNARPR
jgi:hypothetical protein